MSTPAVRTAIMAEITTAAQAVEPGIPIFDLSDYVSIEDLPLNDANEAVLVDFVAAGERMTTIGGSGNQGWEEDGTTAIHWLCPTGFKSQPILTKCESLRIAVRGKRLGKIVLEEFQPFMDSGSPIDVDGGWTGFSSLLYYTRNTCG